MRYCSQASRSLEEAWGGNRDARALVIILYNVNRSTFGASRSLVDHGTKRMRCRDVELI